MRRWSSITIAATMLGAAAILTGGDTANEEGSMLTLLSGHSNADSVGFVITGQAVSGLFPGSTRRMEVSVRNPQWERLRVRSIEARITGTTTRRCQPHSSNLIVRPYRGQLPALVNARSKTRLGYFEVFMPRSAADSCQHTTFSIHFTGRAEQVRK